MREGYWGDIVYGKFYTGRCLVYGRGGFERDTLLSYLEHGASEWSNYWSKAELVVKDGRYIVSGTGDYLRQDVQNNAVYWASPKTNSNYQWSVYQLP